MSEGAVERTASMVSPETTTHTGPRADAERPSMRCAAWTAKRFSFAATGAAILIVSSEFEELLGLADRVIVVSDGADGWCWVFWPQRGEYANTTGNIDLTSNTWSTNAPAPTDHTVPIATLGWAIPWKNRWWAVDTAVPNRIYFTQIFEPQSWPALFYIDIPFERGDGIAAIIAQGDTLVVFGKASKPFVIIGQTSLDFEVRPALGAQAGAFGQRSCDTVENGIIHAAAEGVYIFDGSSDRLLSYNIDPGWQDLVQHSTASDLALIPVVYHGLRKELRIAVPRLYPWGSAGEWILDLNRTRTQEIPAWTQTDRTVGGCYARLRCGRRFDLGHGSRAVGRLRVWI